jgi:hypothetical protein
MKWPLYLLTVWHYATLQRQLRYSFMLSTDDIYQLKIYENGYVTVV